VSEQSSRDVEDSDLARAAVVKNPSDGVGEGVDAHEVAAMAPSRRWWVN
jgi:hypothetical protein